MKHGNYKNRYATKVIIAFVIFIPILMLIAYQAATFYVATYQQYSDLNEELQPDKLSAWQLNTVKIIELGENLGSYFDILFGLPIAFLSAIAAIAIALVALSISERQDRREKEAYDRELKNTIHQSLDKAFIQAKAVWQSARKLDDNASWREAYNTYGCVSIDKIRPAAELLMGFEKYKDNFSARKILEEYPFQLTEMGIFSPQTTPHLMDPKEETQVLEKIWELNNRFKEFKKATVIREFVDDEIGDEIEDVKLVRAIVGMRDYFSDHDNYATCLSSLNKGQQSLRDFLRDVSNDKTLFWKVVEYISNDNGFLHDPHFLFPEDQKCRSEREFFSLNVKMIYSSFFILKAVQENIFQPPLSNNREVDISAKSRKLIHNNLPITKRSVAVQAEKYWEDIEIYFAKKNISSKEEFVRELEDHITKFHCVSMERRLKWVSRDRRHEPFIMPVPFDELNKFLPENIIEWDDSQLNKYTDEIGIAYVDHLLAEKQIDKLSRCAEEVFVEVFNKKNVNELSLSLRERIETYIEFCNALGDPTAPTFEGAISKAVIFHAMTQKEISYYNYPPASEDSLTADIFLRLHEYMTYPKSQNLDIVLEKLLNLAEAHIFNREHPYKTLTHIEADKEYSTWFHAGCRALGLERNYNRQFFNSVMNFTPRGYQVDFRVLASLCVHNAFAKEPDFGRPRFIEYFASKVAKQPTPNFLLNTDKMKLVVLEACSIDSTDEEELQIFNKIWDAHFKTNMN